eukprot:3212058-Lingulodinium_polyedra.AAC.1
MEVIGKNPRCAMRGAVQLVQRVSGWASFPEVLVIGINRYKRRSDAESVVYDEVATRIEPNFTLLLPERYVLRSVAVCTGSARNGHYRCYVYEHSANV